MKIFFYLLKLLLFANASKVAIFSSKEISECGKIREPLLVKTPSRILVFGQCRVYGYQEEEKKKTGLNLDEHLYGDDFTKTVLVSKSSKDGGLSWGDFTKLTGVGYSHQAVVYDHVRQRVMFQFQYHPDPNPSFNTTYYQKFSKDDGVTYGSRKKIDMLLEPCNPHTPNHMMVNSAGSKIITSEGRIIFAAHDDADHVCVWSTTNGGSSFNTSGLMAGGEVSVAEISSGHVLMNGRSQKFAWKPHRTNYFSTDGGVKYGAPQKCANLQDPTDEACEGALLAIPPSSVNGTGSENARNTLYFSEVAAGKSTGRNTLTVYCSKDGGETWPKSMKVDGNNPAGYSYMVAVNKEILIVWEVKLGDGGFYAKRIDTTWC